MDYQGFTASDPENLSGRLTAVENDQKTQDVNIATLQQQAVRLQHSAVYTGTGITAANVLPVDVTPHSGVLGSLSFPYSECTAGMSFRITVFGTMQTSDPVDFRLYISQDTLGNFNYTPLSYENQGTNASPVLKKWSFIITFKQISPLKTVSTTETYPGSVYGPLVDPSNNPISTTGVVFCVCAQFRVSIATQLFTLLTLNMEQIANFS